MDPTDLVNAEEAAKIFSMSVNAFRIFAHRNSKSIKTYKLGKRKTFYSRSNLLSQLKAVTV